MELLEQLKQRSKYINISGLEKEIGCPNTTIHVYMKRGYIPKKWKIALIKWIEENLK